MSPASNGRTWLLVLAATLYLVVVIGVRLAWRHS